MSDTSCTNAIEHLMIGIKILITFNNIYKKVDMYVNNLADRSVECVAIAVRELCDMRDSDDTQVFSGSELKFMIDML